MAKTDARFIKFESQTLKKNASNEIEVLIKPSEVLEKTASGLRVKLNDSATAADNIWSSSKVSGELSAKASITYVDNAVNGLKLKEPVIDFKTQAQLDALSPQTGDRYIVTDGTNINTIAEYNGAWGYTAPADAWTVLVNASNAWYTYDEDDTTWIDTGDSLSEETIVENFTLDASAISAKKVTLTYTPVNANYVKMSIVSGCEQLNGVDFSVNGTTKELSWSGTDLDGLLAANDILIVTYNKY